MASIIIFGILALLVMVFVIILLVISGVLLVKAIRHTDIATVAVRMKKVAIVTVIAIVLCTGFAFFTQFTAYTPPIRDASGSVVPGSIAELEQVELNGRKEWISIRGYDQGKPILLFLAGALAGPTCLLYGSTCLIWKKVLLWLIGINPVRANHSLLLGMRN